MDLLYFLICYVSICISIINSYVLLAANLDDFKSIAKKFVPEKLADEIVEMAKNSGAKYKNRQKSKSTEETSSEYTDYNQFSHQKDLHDAAATETYFKVEQKTPRIPHFEIENTPAPQHEIKSAPLVSRFKIKKSPPSLVAPEPVAPVPAAPLMSLDEIVEKVKQRLHADLLPSAQTVPKDIVRTPIALPANNAKQEIRYEETSYETTHEKYPIVAPSNQGLALETQQQPQLVQNKRIVDKTNLSPKKSRYNVNPQATIVKSRYVKKELLPANPSVQVQPPVKQNKQRIHKVGAKKVTKKQRPRPEKVSPQNQQNEEMVDTPKENEEGLFEAVDMLKSNDSYEDYVTPGREEKYESNVNTITDQPTTVAVDVPLAEDTNQDAGLAIEYEYDEKEGTGTTEPKAKTGEISYEEKETRPDPNVVTTTEALVKGTTKKRKLNTMMPKREFYKMSSPNYYASLPTVAEQYNFKEPLPEADREHEDLKPIIGEEPASINGKVMLL